MRRLPPVVVSFLLSRSLMAGEPPRIDWPTFFSRVSALGAEPSPELTALAGRRVVLRGYALADPRPAGGLFLTRLPEGRLHPDDEETLPWDAVAVVFRQGSRIPAVPRRPTVEGTLRLGNRTFGTETVILTLEDAVPIVEAKPAPAASAAPATGRSR